MRQTIMTSPGIIEFREIPKPESLESMEVLLKIERIGVCGSDIHVFHGEHPATPYPVVQGHEGLIVLLPALPKEWYSGEFHGLCTRGAFELDMQWDKGAD